MQKQDLKNNRIGLVLPRLPEYSETFFVSKIKGLVDSGFQVTIFASGKSEKTSLPVRYVRLPKIGEGGYRWIFHLVFLIPITLISQPRRVFKYVSLLKSNGFGNADILKRLYVNAPILKEKIDWLHFGFLTLAIDRNFVASCIGAKMSASIRGFDVGIYPIKHPGCYDKVWKRLDKLHTISDDLHAKAKSLGLQDNTLVQKITSAINYDNFNTSTEINYSQLAFITVGRLHWKKGIDICLLAMKQLVELGYNPHYTIVGDGPEREKLTYLVADLGLKNHVTMISKIPHSEVKAELSKHPYYLQYSLQEGFCNAVLEAQAMGRICIVSDAEGLSENVLHEETGIVVPRANVSLLVNAVKALIEQPENKKLKLSTMAKERVKMQFNLQKQQQEFKRFFTE